MALKLGEQALKSYLKITFECHLHILPNKKLVPQTIVVKTASSSDRPWSNICGVTVFCKQVRGELLPGDLGESRTTGYLTLCVWISVMEEFLL